LGLLNPPFGKPVFSTEAGWADLASSTLPRLPGSAFEASAAQRRVTTLTPDSRQALSQFEHYRRLRDVVREREACLDDVWVFFSDDDDLWHPGRAGAFTSAVEQVRRRVPAEGEMTRTWTWHGLRCCALKAGKFAGSLKALVLLPSLRLSRCSVTSTPCARASTSGLPAPASTSRARRTCSRDGTRSPGSAKRSIQRQRPEGKGESNLCGSF